VTAAEAFFRKPNSGFAEENVTSQGQSAFWTQMNKTLCYFKLSDDGPCAVGIIMMGRCQKRFTDPLV
jgi:hypothetical protein